MKTFMLALVLTALPTVACAQGLRLPTIVWAAAVTADHVSTYRNLRTGPTAREHNPLLAWTHHRPVPTVLVGVAYDAASYWAVERFVGRDHRQVMRVALYAAAAFRIGLAVRNTARLNAASRPR